MRIVALIPAKGTSHRLSNKNLLAIRGEPLVVRKIRQLKACSLIDVIYVGSDSPEILQLAANEGVVPVRRADIACDEAVSPANVMIKDFCSRVEGDIGVWSHCTNPFLYASHYEKAIRAFLDNREHHDSLLSVSKLQGHIWNQNGLPENYNPYASRHTLAAELPPKYVQDGGIFIQAIEDFRRNSYFFGNRPQLHLHDFVESFDINTPDDFAIAELLAESSDRKFGYVPKPGPAVN